MILYTIGMKLTLISWIGQADLNAAAADGERGAGPVAGALAIRAFDNVELLCNYPKKDMTTYLKWLRSRDGVPGNLHVKHVKLESPTNYTEIYEATASFLKSLTEENEAAELTFHLSPGTPAMTVVWILLASSRYPANLIQSSPERGVEDVQLPFDIASEFVPDLIRTSRKIEDLAEGLPTPAPIFDRIVHRCDAMRQVFAKAQLFKVCWTK